MFVSALTQLVFYLSIQHERNSISMCLEWIFSKIGWFSMVQNRFFKHQKLLNFGHVLWLIKKSVRQKLFINIVSLMSHSLTTEIWRELYSKCPNIYIGCSIMSSGFFGGFEVWFSRFGPLGFQSGIKIYISYHNIL